MNDSYYMAQAWAQAQLGTATWTNPRVGAVIVKADKCLAQGYHHRFGDAHAEIDALARLPDIAMAQGATMYVTLEPCSHYGKTPPCAVRLVAVGIRRVVIGQRDPNPLVAGKGIAILKKAGVAVTVLNTTQALNQAYNFFYRHHRPLVTLKVATSIDGKINVGATRTRLTGPAADVDVQALRARQQAILIGEHTLTIDDPHLTVRDHPLAFPPIRIVLVRAADRLAPTLNVFTADAPTWLLSEHASHKSWPAHVKVFTRAHWDVAAVLRLLRANNLQSLLVEGGSACQAMFLAADCVDRLLLYMAPLTLGGQALPMAVGAPLKAPTTFALQHLTALGDDVKLDYWRR